MSHGVSKVGVLSAMPLPSRPAIPSGDRLAYAPDEGLS